MPNSKVLVHLNVGVFPTIFSQHGSNQPLKRSQRSSRTTLPNVVNSVTAITNTPKQNNKSSNNIETYLSECESDVDGSFERAITSTINSKKIKFGTNGVGIQCEIENDYLRRDNVNE